jgi:hypothetical protein
MSGPDQVNALGLKRMFASWYYNGDYAIGAGCFTLWTCIREISSQTADRATIYIHIDSDLGFIGF